MKQLCIAHRGKHDLEFFENTKHAFEKASKMPFFGIETDVHQTKDKVWITHHNDDIVSGGVSYKIKDLTLDEIMSKHLDNEQNDKDAKVCLFVDYLKICKDSNKTPIIEIKNSPKWKAIKSLLNIIEENIGLKNVYIIGFYPWPLLKIKFHHYKPLRMQLLLSDYKLKTLLKIAKWARFDIDIDYHLLTKEMVEKIHKANRKVNAWTVNDKETLDNMIALNIDYITTDKFTQED